jgi:hypothetical protein
VLKKCSHNTQLLTSQQLLCRLDADDAARLLVDAELELAHPGIAEDGIVAVLVSPALDAAQLTWWHGTAISKVPRMHE